MQIAVLFDLDGTLIDSLSDIAGSLNHVLAAHGLPVHDLERCRELVGDGASALVWRAIPERDRERLHPALLREYKERYRDHLVVDSRPYDGIEEMLEALEARGIPKSVVTNKPHAPALRIVERLLGRFAWTSVHGQVDGVPHKPDPAMASAAARAIGIDPGACVFVGDTRVDVETARAASMLSVGCTWGFRGRAELEEAGAAHVIEHPRELVAIVLDQSSQRTGRGPG